MEVVKWGNSLAVRLPDQSIEDLGLREGDLVDLVPIACRTTVGIAKDTEREAALSRMQYLRWNT